jgi:hypothetical protein
MTQNETETRAVLTYEQDEYEKTSGHTYDAAVYYHPETGDRLVGPELGEKTDTEDEADEYEMRWTCPVCGKSQLSGEWDENRDELMDAGMSSIHVPCADDATKEEAEEAEARFQTNLRAAESDHVKDPQSY